MCWNCSVCVCGFQLTVIEEVQPLVLRQLDAGVVLWQLSLNPDIELLRKIAKMMLKMYVLFEYDYSKFLK